MALAQLSISASWMSASIHPHASLATGVGVFYGASKPGGATWTEQIPTATDLEAIDKAFAEFFVRHISRRKMLTEGELLKGKFRSNRWNCQAGVYPEASRGLRVLRSDGPR